MSSRSGSTTRTLFADRGAGDERPSVSSTTSTALSPLVSTTTRLRHPLKPSGVGLDVKVHSTPTSSIPPPANSCSSPYRTGGKNRRRHLRATTPVPPFSWRLRRVLSSVRVRERFGGGKKTRRVRRTSESAVGESTRVSGRTPEARRLNSHRCCPWHALSAPPRAPSSLVVVRLASSVKGERTAVHPPPVRAAGSTQSCRFNTPDGSAHTDQEGDGESNGDAGQVHRRGEGVHQDEWQHWGARRRRRHGAGRLSNQSGRQLAPLGDVERRVKVEGRRGT